jgi:hypothetical protein
LGLSRRGQNFMLASARMKADSGRTRLAGDPHISASFRTGWAQVLAAEPAVRRRIGGDHHAQLLPDHAELDQLVIFTAAGDTAMSLALRPTPPTATSSWLQSDSRSRAALCLLPAGRLGGRRSIPEGEAAAAKIIAFGDIDGLARACPRSPRGARWPSWRA